MTYTAEENGRQITAESAYADEGKCVFVPPLNPIYFMIHAVGGGGAGAQIQTSMATMDPPKQTSALSYLYSSSPALFPDWVTYLVSKGTANLPWGAATRFDVNKVSYQQIIRYRLGGTAAKVVSLFVPQIPPTVTLEIIPGEGGERTRNGDGSGGDGGDTIVRFVYKDGGAVKKYDAIVAKGGIGGNGSIDGKTSKMMIGGTPGDEGLSNYASIRGREAGFSDIIESAEQFDALKTRITYNAGEGGNGETQYVSDTSGFVLYEYGKNDSINSSSRRIGTTWENITNDVGLNVYRSTGLTSNCSSATKSNIEITRSGYCTPETPTLFDCTIGYNANADDKQCSDPTRCSHFKVTYDKPTKTATFNPNPQTYSEQTKFYSCEFSYTTFTIRCKTILNNQRVHNCTTPTTTNNKCSNGDTPTGTGYDKKCPAKDGGDGAVVILW